MKNYNCKDWKIIKEEFDLHKERGVYILVKYENGKEGIYYICRQTDSEWDDCLYTIDCVNLNGIEIDTFMVIGTAESLFTKDGAELIGIFEDESEVVLKLGGLEVYSERLKHDLLIDFIANEMDFTYLSNDDLLDFAKKSASCFKENCSSMDCDNCTEEHFNEEVNKKLIKLANELDDIDIIKLIKEREKNDTGIRHTLEEVKKMRGDN